LAEKSKAQPSEKMERVKKLDIALSRYASMATFIGSDYGKYSLLNSRIPRRVRFVSPKQAHLTTVLPVNFDRGEVYCLCKAKSLLEA
jgi:hypothetical protein